MLAPGRGEFNRQGQTVELARDPGYGGRVLYSQLEARRARAGAFDKQANRIRLTQNAWIGLGVLHRGRQVRYRVLMLTGDMERLPAGHQHRDVWTGGENFDE